jgi:hypothetical protein
MRKKLEIFVFVGLTLALSTLNANARDCPKLSLTLARGLTEKILADNWGTGNSLAFENARLTLQGCNRNPIDSIQLSASLARIDQILRLRKDQVYVVTTDLSQPAGSYNGPLTEFYSVSNSHIERIDAAFSDDSRMPVRLSKTGKSDWKEEVRGGHTDFYYITCYLKNGKFFISHFHFRVNVGLWKGAVSIDPGFWEFGGGIREIPRFP